MDSQLVKSRLARITPALLWMLGIFILSSRSTIPKAPGISSELVAIAGHLVAYGILAVLIARGNWADFGRASQRAALAWGVTVLYGISDEIHQSFVTGRFATIEDVGTNAAGAAIGLTVTYFVTRWHRERATA